MRHRLEDNATHRDEEIFSDDILADKCGRADGDRQFSLHGWQHGEIDVGGLTRLQLETKLQCTISGDWKD